MLKKRGPLLVIACASALLASAPQAGAVADRAEYAAQVNPICLEHDRRAKSLNRGFVESPTIVAIDRGNGNVDAKRAMRVVSRFLTRYVRLLERRSDLVVAIPAPPGDEALVASWMEALRLIIASQRASNRVNLDGARFNLKHSPTGRDEDLSARERVKQQPLRKRLQRAADRLFDAIVRADDLAEQLGAGKCMVTAGSEPNAASRAGL